MKATVNRLCLRDMYWPAQSKTPLSARRQGPPGCHGYGRSRNTRLAAWDGHMPHAGKTTV